MKSIRDYSSKTEDLKRSIEGADAILVGAGAGFSTSAGISYSGQRFETHFADFISRYHFKDMYSATFYPYDTQEEYWAYMSRHIDLNRYQTTAGKPYLDLLALVKEKDYFALTTNVDHQFQKAGFDKQRLFYTQGDYGLWQCAKPCHHKTYDNQKAVKAMVAAQNDLRIPSELIPRCPICGEPMSMNLRCDNTFVEDEGWHQAAKRYAAFAANHEKGKTLYLELGVGSNTPSIIKFPFWRMTMANGLATYACINMGESMCPKEIEGRAICIDADIGQTLESVLR